MAPKKKKKMILIPLEKGPYHQFYSGLSCVRSNRVGAPELVSVFAATVENLDRHDAEDDPRARGTSSAGLSTESGTPGSVSPIS